MFTVEALYIFVIVFSVLLIFISSLQLIDVPSYDLVQTLKVAHDVGENNTSSAPPGYLIDSCDNKTTAVLSYYSSTEVCMK